RRRALCQPHARIAWVRVSITSPRVRPSPNDRRVGIRIRTFEACSGFTSITAHHFYYGPSDRSAAQGRLRRRAPTQPVTRPSRLLASGPIDNYPGETLPHWSFAPAGRTVIRVVHPLSAPLT